MRTGGQVLADGLVAHGSELAFCVPGESYLALLDGLYEHRDAFRIVNCRHEGAAANAADAYGKLTGPARAVPRHPRAGGDARRGRRPHRAPGLDAAAAAGRAGRARGAWARVLPGARLRGRVRADGEVGVRDRRPRAHPRGTRARVHGGDERAARARSCWRCPRTCSRLRSTCPTRRATARCGRRRRRRRWRSSGRCSRRRSGRSCSSAAGRGTRVGARRSRAGRSGAGCRSARRSAARTSSTTRARATPATSASASTRRSRSGSATATCWSRSARG